jgi:SAM-dependent methyltransferase
VVAFFQGGVRVDLDPQRRHERGKYLWLKRNKPRYGKLCHGKPHFDTVLGHSPRTLADFGCGDNAFCRRLRGYGVEAVGIDWAFDDADVVRPMHDTNLPAGSFDYITSFDALEHLLPHDVVPVLQEMRRIANDRARFCFTIAYTPSKNLVKGENLHPTVRPQGWWLDQIKTHLGPVTTIENRGLYGSVAKCRS